MISLSQTNPARKFTCFACGGDGLQGLCLQCGGSGKIDCYHGLVRLVQQVLQKKSGRREKSRKDTEVMLLVEHVVADQVVSATSSKSSPRYSCDLCHATIWGCRFHCFECEDFDLCSTCKASACHPHSLHEIICGEPPQDKLKDCLRQRMSKSNLLNNKYSQIFRPRLST